MKNKPGSFGQTFKIGDKVDLYAGQQWHTGYTVTARHCTHYGECSPKKCKYFKYDITSPTYSQNWIGPDSLRPTKGN